MMFVRTTRRRLLCGTAALAGMVAVNRTPTQLLSSHAFAAPTAPAESFGGDPNAAFTSIDPSGGIKMNRTSGSTPAFVHVSAANIRAAGSVLDANRKPLGASFTGSITGTTLTVTEGTVSGAIAIGQTIYGNGVAADTVINGGSGLSWTVTKSQAASGPMNSVPALREWERLEYRWDFGNPEGTETFTDPRNGKPVNANTDQFGPEAVYCYRTPGDKTITLNIRALKPDGTFLTESVRATFRVSDFKPSGGDYYYDSIHGNDSNSGNSPHSPWRSLWGKGPINSQGDITSSGPIRINLAHGSRWDNGLAPNAVLRINTKWPIRITGWANPNNQNSTKPVLKAMGRSARSNIGISGVAPINDCVISFVDVEVDQGATVRSSCLAFSCGLPPMAGIALGATINASATHTINFTAGLKTVTWKDHGLANHQPVTIAGSKDAIIPDGKYWVQAANLTNDSFELRKTQAAGGANSLIAASTGVATATSTPVLVTTAGRVVGGNDNILIGIYNLYDDSGALPAGNGTKTNNVHPGWNYELTGSSIPSIRSPENILAVRVADRANATGKSGVFNGTIVTTGGVSILKVGNVVDGNTAPLAAGYNPAVGQLLMDIDGSIAPYTTILSNKSGSGANSQWIVTTQPNNGTIGPKVMVSADQQEGLRNVYFDNLILTNSAKFENGGGGNVAGLYGGGAPFFSPTSSYSGMAFWNCTCSALTRNAGLPVTYGAREWMAWVGMKVSANNLVMPSATKLTITGSGDAGPFIIPGNATTILPVNARVWAMPQDDAVAATYHMQGVITQSAYDRLSNTTSVTFTIGTKTSSPPSNGVGTFSNWLLVRPGGGRQHFINPENSMRHLCCRWTSTDAGPGAYCSGLSYAFHPRVNAFYNGSPLMDYIGGYVLVSDCRFTCSSNAIDANNEPNANQNTIIGYYREYLCQNTDFGWFSGSIDNCGSVSNLTMRDCKLWMFDAWFQPANGGDNGAPNGLAPFLSSCIYRNRAYHPAWYGTADAVSPYGGIGIYGDGGRPLGSPVLQYFTAGTQLHTQWFTDNIIQDDSASPQTIAMKLANMIATQSVFARNKYWLPNATNSKKFISDGSNWNTLAHWQNVAHPSTFELNSTDAENPNWPAPGIGNFGTS